MPRTLGAPAATGLALVIALAGCGTPEPPNIREEFSTGIQRLGMTAFYPLSESARLGQVFLVDPNAVKSGDVAAFIPTSVLLTNAAVPEMEKRRAVLVASANRFPCSSDELSTQVSGDRSYYRQAACATPPAASGTLAPLALGGIPSYSLASIDSLSLAGAVPTEFGNFLAALGWRETTSLRVEAEGVEIAKLPVDDFATAIIASCSQSGNVFSDPRLARPSLELARAELAGYANKRRELAAQEGIKLDKQPFQLYMLREVYYLRGIRYIVNNSEAYATVLEAAAKSGVKAAETPPAAPAIAMNIVPSGAAASTSVPAATSADVAALQAQIDSLRSAISSTTNIQVGGTFARATARGIEFVELFQRPLAFGYVALVSPFEFKPERGYEDFCFFARGGNIQE